MEKIKKYSYYLFIYALFAAWLFLLGVFLFIFFSVLFFVIDVITISNVINFLPYILTNILIGTIIIFLCYMLLKYFGRVKKFETAKIKNVILAVVVCFLGYLSFCLMFILLIYVSYWVDVNLTSLTTLILV